MQTATRTAPRTTRSAQLTEVTIPTRCGSAITRLSVNEAAGCLRCSSGVVRELIAECRIPGAYRVPSTGQRWIPLRPDGGLAVIAYTLVPEPKLHATIRRLFRELEDAFSPCLS